MDEIEIKDEQGRILMKSNEDGSVLLGRYPDMSQELKDQMLEFFCEITGEDVEKTRKFLNFESDKNEFCS